MRCNGVVDKRPRRVAGAARSVVCRVFREEDAEASGRAGL